MWLVDVVAELERIPGFRNVVIHEYVALDLDRVVDALDIGRRSIADHVSSETTPASSGACRR